MRWIPAAAGLVATAAAVVVLASIQTAPEPLEAIATETTTQPGVPTVEVVEPAEQPAVGVPDLAGSVADVLAQDGYTEFVGETRLIESLPADVVQLLIDSEAVLLIAEKGEG